MREVWLDFIKCVDITGKNLGRFIKYQIVTKLLIAILFMPMIKGIFSLAMKSRGYDYITNGLVKKFLVSPQGILCVIFSLIVLIVIIMIELGGMVLLSYQGIVGFKEQNYLTVVKYCLSKVKYLLGIDGLFVLFYLMIIAPFTNSDITTSVLKKLKIPGFIMDTIYSKDIYLLCLVLLFGVLVFFGIRWMFSIQYIMLSKKSKHSFKHSSKLVGKNFKKIIGYSFWMTIFTLIFLLGFILCGTFIIVVILMIFNIKSESDIVIFILSIIAVGILLGSFLMVPFEVTKNTLLFTKLNERELEDDFGKVKFKKNFVDNLLKSKIFIVGMFGVAFLIAGVGSYITMELMDDIKYEVAITAHRGSSKDAPENTIAALKAAISNGADYAEIDVQETKDGKLVLLHDKTFERTSGLNKGSWELTLEEIKQLDVGSWFGEKFQGEKVPTLEEVINFSRGKIKLNIEIKTNGHEGKLVESVVDLIKRENFLNECVVTSLNYEVIEEVEEIEPMIRSGYIMFVAVGNLEKLNVDFYSVEETNVTEAFVEKAHRINRQVHVWTINTEESFDNMVELGVDNIITDNDKEFCLKIKELKKKN